MNLFARWIKAIYHFLVGDMHILLGTFGTLFLVAFLRYGWPSGVGLLLFGLLAITLTLALRREIAP